MTTDERKTLYRELEKPDCQNPLPLLALLSRHEDVTVCLLTSTGSGLVERGTFGCCAGLNSTVFFIDYGTYWTASRKSPVLLNPVERRPGMIPINSMLLMMCL